MKSIKNIKFGHHLNSNFWQDWKRKRPFLNHSLYQVCIGIVLSDATMYGISKDAIIKFEQGYAQKEFIDHLYQKMKGYTFIDLPGIRYDKIGNVKSYWFKTFSHPTFSIIYQLFYNIKKKSIQPSLVLNHLEKEGLAYWVIGDGSLHREKRVVTLHTQSYNYEENLLLSKELNEKFLFSSKVVKHKTSFVIQFPTKDANKLHTILSPYLLSSMKYKLPKKINSLMI